MDYKLHLTGRNVVILVAFTLAWMFLMRWMTAPLSSATIVAFELAGTLQNANKQLGSFTPATIESIRWSIYLDFVFLMLYAALLFTALQWLGTKISTLWIQRMLYAISWTMWLAAFADVVENLAMLYSLHQLTSWSVAIAYWFAVAKFGIISFCGVCLLAFGTVKLLFQRI